ncbi:polysaccharide pyruvyl transferase family protein [Lactiplantibacillus carotarum]|uniref:polysaccharide pyruvyl transferase family protein n=1 Tax=Lactiplantibacillus carotarum TaxID=2993456 RepID=UPI00298F11D7|nr:polysaccharide pyruvyl transferase family protein [Lactiplantibacillus carotarum]
MCGFFRIKKESIIKSDTYINIDRVTDSNRLELLTRFWKEISSHKLIITDRLHGMIFGYLTQTPVIVFPNNNWKIESTYRTWLTGVSYISLIDSPMTNEAFYSEIQKVLKNKPKFVGTKNKFSILKDKLREIITNE